MATVSQTHKIPIMGKAWWLKAIGGKLQRQVEKELLKGKMMDDTSSHRYSSKYAKYKANNMKRFTDGKRLKGHEMASIHSNDTAKVTMILSGRTIRGLHPSKADKNSVTMTFKPADAKKIIGNKERNDYDIVGLNSKLRNWVFIQMGKKIDQNMRKYLKKNRVITIK